MPLSSPDQPPSPAKKPSLFSRLFGLLKNPEPFYYHASKILVRALYRVRYEGFEHIPQTGPAIIISNHVSYMDGLVINTGLNRRIRYVIYEKIYRQPGVHYFMKLNRAIPIDSNREAVAVALEKIKEALENGECICLFPEGKLTLTGNMNRFRFGIEWILEKYPATVYPVALKGLWGSIMSKKYSGSRFGMFPRSFRRRVVAKCGEPIPADSARISHLQKIIMELKNSIDLAGS